jgi:hypothetical protein
MRDILVNIEQSITAAKMMISTGLLNQFSRAATQILSEPLRGQGATTPA